MPLAFGLGLMALMTSWKRGRDLLLARWKQASMPLSSFLARLPQSRTMRVPGMAVFLTGNPDYVPTALLHNLKHNKVLHERVLFVTVQNHDEPEIGRDRRTEVEELAPGVHRVVLRYGFMESPNIPRALEELKRFGGARPAGQLLPRARGDGAGDGAEDAAVAAVVVPGAGAQRGARHGVLSNSLRSGGGAGGPNYNLAHVARLFWILTAHSTVGRWLIPAALGSDPLAFSLTVMAGLFRPSTACGSIRPKS